MTQKVRPSTLADTTITPGTYGGATVVPSFTVDQQGRMTYAGNTNITISGSQVTSIANTQITGLITSNQIASVANTQVTGLINSNQISSVANTQITGYITSSQIGTVANTQITGKLTSAQIVTVANTQITGKITAAQLSGGLGLGIGGETWHSVSRAARTTYTNSRGYPIGVSVHSTATGVQVCRFYIDGSLVYNFVTSYDGGAPYGNGGGFIIVPAGSTYYCDLGDYASVSAWWELY